MQAGVNDDPSAFKSQLVHEAGHVCGTKATASYYECSHAVRDHSVEVLKAFHFLSQTPTNL